MYDCVYFVKLIFFNQCCKLVGQLCLILQISVTPVKDLVLKTEDVTYLTNVPSKAKNHFITVLIDDEKSHMKNIIVGM